MRLHLLLPVALVAGCTGDRPAAFDRNRTILGPVPLKDQIAWVDTGFDRVVTLDLSADTPRVHSWNVGRNPVYAAPTPDRDHLLVVTRGEEALARGQRDEDPQLWDVDLAHPDIAPIAYQVGSPFDRIAVASDGSHAVAYFSEAGPDEAGFFRNPNEMAFVDLRSAPTETNPVLKTLRAFGSTPTGVVLSPPMSVAGAEDPSPRTFALVFSHNVVTVVDTSHADRNEVSLRLDSAGSSVDPREAVFAPASATAYLRSDGARDVLQIAIAADPPLAGDPHANDYRPLLAELGAGGGPADIAVFDDAASKRWVLASTPTTREVVIIDSDTAQFRKVATADAVDRITLFPPDHPNVAVLASLATAQPRVQLLSLEHLDDPLRQLRLESIALGEPVRDVVPVPGRNLAMIIHDDNRTVLSLLDVTYGSVSPLDGAGRLDSYAFTASGDFLVGTAQNVSRLGYLDLANLHPSDIRLDSPPVRVLALGNGKIVADHGDPFGRVTIVPFAGARRADAIVLDGFLLSDVLDQEP
ncbi:MAG: hypothetical protein K8W52_16935 [Deltaproteobacteria bacterium]|nr:hypothetical protein [Deltaproteobacteria bacterium]